MVEENYFVIKPGLNSQNNKMNAQLKNDELNLLYVRMTQTRIVKLDTVPHQKEVAPS
jgi:hypothetical protein